jgi:hypothetical protein
VLRGEIRSQLGTSGAAVPQLYLLCSFFGGIFCAQAEISDGVDGILYPVAVHLDHNGKDSVPG